MKWRLTADSSQISPTQRLLRKQFNRQKGSNARLSAIDLAGIRQFVRPELSDMPAEELEQVVEQSLAGLPSDTTEDFLSMLGSVAKAVAPTLQRAAPAIIQGAASGATVGGPWGALIGAGAGLASSALRKPNGAPAPAAPSPAAMPPTAAATAAATAVPAAPAAAALPTGQDAAGAILSILGNETFRKSLLSQVLGSTGAEQVRTATGTSLPRAAINNLLAQLFTNATEGLPEAESISEQSYLLGESGEYLVDPASPEQQAALVLSHLQAPARPPRLSSSPSDFVEISEWMSEGLYDSESEEWIESEESSEMVLFY